VEKLGVPLNLSETGGFDEPEGDGDRALRMLCSDVFMNELGEGSYNERYCGV
jgi:hypothetical protein